MLWRAGDWVWRSAAGRGGLVFVLASITVSLSNFVFHLVLSRLLGPSAYGALGALVNVTAVATVPLAAIQVTVAQSIAVRSEPSETPPLGRLLRIAATAAVVALALWLAATPTMDRFFHLSSPRATIWLGVWLVPSVLNAALEGVLLGQRRFRVVAVGQLVGGGAARLAAGVVLVELGFGVTGGVIATVLASTVVLVVYAGALRRALLAGGPFVPKAGDAVLSTVALGGTALLTSLDAWLGRHFLSAQQAGLFVAAATAGNIALFLPSAITTVYFPRLASTGGKGAEARQVLARATGLVATLAIAAAAAIALFPGLTVGILFGSSFSRASVAMGTVALADAGIAVAGCLVYFQVARRSRLALAPWLCCALAVALAAAFHGSIEVLAVDMLVACWALVLGLGVPTAVAALRTFAEDTSTLGRHAILLDQPVVDLSIVVPFYNVGAERLSAHLAGICETLATSGVSFELVPVSDGSTDGSTGALATLVQLLPDLPAGAVRPIAFADNRGKGEALRAGLAHGRGRYLGFIDGDGDIPAAGLVHFVRLARQQQPEIVVGSKRHRDAQVEYPPLRHLYSAGYQALTAALFGLRVRDTQTGIKLVRRDVLAEVLPRMVEKRFAFDLELLAVAHRIGYRQVAELPVTIGERFPSTISLPAVWRMLHDTLAVFWRLRLLRFYDAPLVEPGSEAVVNGATVAERLARGEPLRILLCNWRDLAHPSAGGAEVYTHRVLQDWAARGHRVVWFTSAVDGRPSVEVVDGVTVVRRGGRHTVYRQARRFWERVGAGRFDLVIDEVNTRPFEAARWATGTPVLALCHQLAREVWFHELWWPVAAIGRFFMEPRWLRRLRDVPVLTVSESSRQSLMDAGLTDVTVVPEGIDPVVVPEVARESNPTVVFVGRLSPNKRPDHAVEAFRLLRRQIPAAQLWVMGRGPMEAQLRRSAPDGVTFLGHVSESEKLERLARAHCLVSTSVREGWGLNITEAAQVGTPAVAYDVDGLRDSVGASGGVLVPPRPDRLAEALVSYLPGWAAAPAAGVNPGGVLPWPEVAQRLLSDGAAALVDRERLYQAGEDVRVAWRRVMGPVAAFCDRRIWSVAGVAALVALAPLSEAGAASAADGVAGIAFASLIMATIGAWADAVRWPPPGRARRPQVDGGPSARWRRVLAVGALSALLVQAWFGTAFVAPSGWSGLSGGRWYSSLALAYSSSSAAYAYRAALLLPIGAADTALRWVGLSDLTDARAWTTLLFAAAAMAMTWMLTAIGLRRASAVVGGLVYAFSPYVMAMSGLAPAYLAAMALVPGTVAWVALAAADTGGRWWRRLPWAVPGAMLLGMAASSPALLVACLSTVLGAPLLVWWLHGRDQLVAAMRRVVVACAAIVIAASYWLLPFVTAIVSGNLAHQAATRNWQWAQQRASLPDALWLNTAFDWHVRATFPYAGDFHHFPLVLLRYALPVAAVAVLGFPDDRRWSGARGVRLRVAAGVAVVGAMLLATGQHLPGAPLVGLLTALPAGWVFEDPGRFLFIAGAAYAVLVSTLIEEVMSPAGTDGQAGATPALPPVPEDRGASLSPIATAMGPGGDDSGASAGRATRVHVAGAAVHGEE